MTGIRGLKGKMGSRLFFAAAALAAGLLCVAAVLSSCTVLDGFANANKSVKIGEQTVKPAYGTSEAARFKISWEGIDFVRGVTKPEWVGWGSGHPTTEPPVVEIIGPSQGVYLLKMSWAGEDTAPMVGEWPFTIKLDGVQAAGVLETVVPGKAISIGKQSAATPFVSGKTDVKVSFLTIMTFTPTSNAASFYWADLGNDTTKPSVIPTASVTWDAATGDAYNRTGLLTLNFGDATLATGEYFFGVSVEGVEPIEYGHLVVKAPGTQADTPDAKDGNTLITKEGTETSEADPEVTLALDGAAYDAKTTLFKIYSTPGTLASGITATYDEDNNTITFKHSIDIPAGTYYVTVTLDSSLGLAESAPLEITIQNAPRSAVPVMRSFTGRLVDGKTAYFAISNGADYGEGAVVTVYADPEAAGTAIKGSIITDDSGSYLTFPCEAEGHYYGARVSAEGGLPSYPPVEKELTVIKDKAKFFMKFDGDLNNEFGDGNGVIAVRNYDGSTAPAVYIDGKFTGTKALHLTRCQYIDLGPGPSYYGANQDFTVAMWVKMASNSSLTKGTYNFIYSDNTAGWYIGNMSTEAFLRFCGSYADSSYQSTQPRTGWSCIVMHFTSKANIYLGMSTTAPTSAATFNGSPENFDRRLDSGGSVFLGNQPTADGSMAFTNPSDQGLEWDIQNLIIVPGRVELSDIFAGTADPQVSSTPILSGNLQVDGEEVESAAFTLANKPAYLASTVFKVYETTSSAVESTKLSAAFSGSTLTLTRIGEGASMPAGYYYIKAVEAGKPESAGYAEVAVMGISAIESVSLDQNSLTLDTNGVTGATLKASVLPLITKATYTWQSSNTNVATVDDDGVVTAVGKGSATITVSASNSATVTAKTQTATVNVKGSTVIWDWNFERDGGMTLTGTGSAKAGTLVAKKADGTTMSALVATWDPNATNVATGIQVKGGSYGSRFVIGANSTTNSTSSNSQNSTGQFNFSATNKTWRVCLDVTINSSASTSCNFFMMINNNTSGQGHSQLGTQCVILNLNPALASTTPSPGTWAIPGSRLVSKEFGNSADYFSAGLSTLSTSYIGFVSATATNPASVILRGVRIVEYEE